MITEDYVSFEVAKLLKEKGFDEPCIYVYRHDGSEDIWDADKEDIACQKPTLQMAMKWLREVHGIDISIAIRFWTDDEGVDVKSWRYTVYRTDEIEDFGQSDTYEEAAEAAIKYCVENLV